MTDRTITDIDEQNEHPQDNGPTVESPAGQTSAEIDVARAEASEWRDKYVRLLAEFDNYRKRISKDFDVQRIATTEQLLSGLLTVMDDFDRMLASKEGTNDPYRRGAELIRDKLRGYLQARGVERMASQGKPFDPAEHDALLVRPTADFPPGTVLEEITPGYRLGDRVIRHAQVVVSEAPEVEPPQPSPIV